MSFFGGSKSSPSVKPDYTGLQLQTAVNALPIPIVWGMTKIAPNIIWYNGFVAIPKTSGGGGGKGFSQPSTVTGYDYRASVILALCEGPIGGIGAVWRGQSTYTLHELGLSFFAGTTPQAVWSFLTVDYPNQALAYQGTAYVASASYDLSSGATLDNHNFEVQSQFYASGANGVDADPARVIYDFLVNQQYGCASNTGATIAIDTTTLFGSGNDASLQTYCAGVGIAFSPGLTSQETASSILKRWLEICNTAAVWSGGQLKFIPYGDLLTVAGAVQSASVQFNVPAGGTFITPVPEIYVAPPASFVADQGVKYIANGALLTNLGGGIPTVPGTYTVSPPGTYLFAPGDENAGVQIAYEYSVGGNYVPDVTPVYDLGDDDFVAAKSSNEDPLQAARSDPYGAYNVWRLEIAERANAYNITTVESRDQNAIELYGMRIAPTVTAHEICDPNVALISGQLMLQRAVYIRNTYTFKLSWEYCLLDPMDLVTVTDALLGLNKAPIRITQTEEDENGILSVTAEEFPQGTQTATLYATQPTANNPINRNAPAPAIATPLLFEPTDELGGGLQIWAAVCGSGTNWGGCNVWASFQAGGNYENVGTINNPARLGIITTVLPAVAVNPIGQTIDLANVLSVNLTESGGTLGSGTTQDATALNNACYIGGEVLSYATAALTSSNNYNLSYLVRGAFGTEGAIVNHPAGTPFARLDGAIFKFAFDQSRIGQTVYLKFQSFNPFGGGPQSLADCAAYPYTITGSALASPLPNVTNLRAAYDVNSGFTQLDWDDIADFRPFKYEIRNGASPSAAMTLGQVAHPPFRVPGDGTYWVAAISTPVSGLTVYSETWQEIVIAGAVITQNVIKTVDLKALNWPGTFQGGAGVDSTINAIRTGGGNILTDPNILTTPDVLNYGGGTAGIYYPDSNAFLDIGYVANVSVAMAYQPTGVPVGQNILTIGDILNMPDVLGSAATRYVDVYPQINTGNAPGGDLYAQGDLDLYQYPDLYLIGHVNWNGWQKFSPGTYQTRFLYFSMVMSTVDPQIIAYDLAWKIIITIPSRIDSYGLTTSSSADTTVTFGQAGVVSTAPLASTSSPFNGGAGVGNLPAITWGIANAQAGDDLIITALSLTSVSFKILNGGSRVVRNLTLFATGY